MSIFRISVICLVWLCSGVALASDWNGSGTPPKLVESKQFAGKTEFPMIEGPLLGGGKYSLAAHKGKVVIVQLWSVVCPYCHKELPNLQAFVEQHKAKGLEWVGLSVDDSEAEIQAYLAKNPKLKFTIVWRLHDDEKDGFARARGTPTTYVVDRKGDIVFKRWGVLTEADYAWIVKQL